MTERQRFEIAEEVLNFAKYLNKKAKVDSSSTKEDCKKAKQLARMSSIILEYILEELVK
jgi:hypothetical protein